LLGRQGQVLPGTPKRPEPADVFSEPDCAPTGKLQRAALAEPTSPFDKLRAPPWDARLDRGMTHRRHGAAPPLSVH